MCTVHRAEIHENCCNICFECFQLQFFDRVCFLTDILFFSLIQNKEINKFNFMKPLPNKRTALIIMIMVLQSIFWKVQTFCEETLTSHRKSVFLVMKGIYKISIYIIIPSPLSFLDLDPNTALRRQADLWGLGSKMLEMRGRYDVAYYSPYLSFLWSIW